MVVHPVAIRYTFPFDVESAAAGMLDEIEARLTWRPSRELPLHARFEKSARGLLALKELQYLGHTQEGTIPERITKLIEAILTPLEAEWTNGNGDGHPVARVKRLRTAILPDMIKGDLDETEKTRRWRLLEDAELAQQLYHYPPHYVAQGAPRSRIIETVERFEEDLTGKVTVHGPVNATVTVGDAIEVSSGREVRGESDPLMTSIETQFAHHAGHPARLRRRGNQIMTIAPWPVIGVRVGLVVAGIFAWYVTQALLAKRVPKVAYEVPLTDGLHVLTRHIHHRYGTNVAAGNRLLIISSLVIDLLGAYLLGSAIFGVSMRPYLGPVMLFTCARSVRCFVRCRRGPGWCGYPGVPAILVTYGTANDLFFSGHTAIAVYGAATLAGYWGPWGLALGLAIALFEAITVLVLRRALHHGRLHRHYLCPLGLLPQRRSYAGGGCGDSTLGDLRHLQVCCQKDCGELLENGGACCNDSRGDSVSSERCLVQSRKLRFTWRTHQMLLITVLRPRGAGPARAGSGCVSTQDHPHARLPWRLRYARGAGVQRDRSGHAAELGH